MKPTQVVARPLFSRFLQKISIHYSLDLEQDLKDGNSNGKARWEETGMSWLGVVYMAKL